MIQGVVIKQLRVLSDERGSVMHMLRRDTDIFRQFGEIYFSWVNAGIIKGWKKHLRMTQHFAVPAGNIKLVIYDDRSDSATCGEVQEIGLGVDNYCLVRIPCLVWYAFRATGNQPALVANCTDIEHDPQEVTRADLADRNIPYDWRVQGG